MSAYVYTYTYTDSDDGPALVDFDFWRGNNLPPVIFGLENEGGSPFPTAGSVFALSIEWPGGRIEKSTSASGSGFVLNGRTSELTWTPTLAESRDIPLGAVAKYEIERRVGPYQETFIRGVITGKGGINND